MIDTNTSRYCWRCKDNYYNTNDIESIKETTKCCYCAKEVSLKQELAEIRKKKSVKRSALLENKEVI